MICSDMVGSSATKTLCSARTPWPFAEPSKFLCPSLDKANRLKDCLSSHSCCPLHFASGNISAPSGSVRKYASTGLVSLHGPRNEVPQPPLATFLCRRIILIYYLPLKTNNVTPQPGLRTHVIDTQHVIDLLHKSEVRDMDSQHINAFFLCPWLPNLPRRPCSLPC